MTLDISDYSPDDAESTSAEASEESNQELEAAASDDETQAVEESESNEDEEAEQAPKGRSEKLQRLIDSKGGEEKFADNIYSIFNSNKALFKEIEALKEQIATRASEPEKPINLDEDEDYKGFKDEIVAIESDLQDCQSEREELVSKFNVSKAREAKYAGAMQNAEPFERLRYQEKMEEEQERQDELRAKWKASQKLEQRLARSKSSLETKLAKSEERAKSVAKQQQLKAKEDSQAAVTYERMRTSVVDEMLLDVGIDDPDEVEELQEAIRLRAAAKIMKSGPFEDFEAGIREIATKYLAPYKQQTFKQVSTAKKEASRPTQKVAANPNPSPKPQTRPQTRSKDGKLTAAQAKANIDNWIKS